MGNNWSESWIPNNGSTTYSPEARIYKNVVNKVTDQSIKCIIARICFLIYLNHFTIDNMKYYYLKYNQEETVVVEIICKVHAPSTRIAKAVVYHEGQEIQTNVWNSELNIR